MYQTRVNRSRSEPEKNNGISKVEKAGYIPAKKRIENMILAGQRLVQARKDQYDFNNAEPDENFDDPTRRKNYDPADATQDGFYAQSRIKASKDRYKDQIQKAKESKEGNVSSPKNQDTD